MTDRRSMSWPPRTRRLIAVVAVALTASLGATTVADAAPAPEHPAVRIAMGDGAAPAGDVQVARTGARVRYAVPQPACGAPKPGWMSCMAVRLKPSARGAADAHAYVVPNGAAGPAGGFTPLGLSQAYGYNPASSRGASQTVAVIDAYDDPYARRDLNRFDAHYGLPAETSTSFRKVNRYGKTSPLPAANAAWAGEIALDIQAVRAVCNHCKILLVEANSASSAGLATAANTAAAMGATEISNSYGGPEYSASASLAAAYKHPGIVITASTGDDGWYGWDLANDQGGSSSNAPNVPAAYPTVVAVGGTSLAVNSDGTRSSEQVWNGNGLDDSIGIQSGDSGATGGGCSALYSAPGWQKRVSGYAATGCGTKRLAADVAADADPYSGFDTYDTYAGGWGTIGGTSLSAPLIAAMWALAGGSGGASYPAQSLYDHLEYQPSSVYDVTVGGNGFCGGDTAANCSAVVNSWTGNATGNPNNLADDSNQWLGLLDCGFDPNGGEAPVAADTQCNAAAGYDGPSGVGTPNGLTAFTRMGPSISMTTPSLLKLNTTAGFSATGFRDTIPGAALKSYKWYWGDGATVTTTNASVTHRYTTRGTYTLHLVVSDTAAHAFTVTKRFALGYAPTASISGRTTVPRRTTYTWAARTSERNTGGRIVAWNWKIDSRVYSRTATLRHAFRYRGSYKVTLTVRDNSGLRGQRTITVKVV